eukprot:6194984-Pleurochrysis_carterae.AAC.2
MACYLRRFLLSGDPNVLPDGAHPCRVPTPAAWPPFASGQTLVLNAKKIEPIDALLEDKCDAFLATPRAPAQRNQRAAAAA